MYLHVHCLKWLNRNIERRPSDQNIAILEQDWLFPPHQYQQKNIHRHIKIPLYIKGILDYKELRNPDYFNAQHLKRFYEKKKPNFHIKIT